MRKSSYADLNAQDGSIGYRFHARGMRSGRSRAGVNDRPNVLATQRRGEPAWHEPVYDLHALEMVGSCHDLEKRTVERQRAPELCKIDDVGLAQKLRLLSARVLGVGGVHSVHVLHDREASRAQRVRQQECTRVSPVDWNARVRELVVVIRRERTAHNRAGRGEVNR